MADDQQLVTTPVSWIASLGRGNRCRHCGEPRAAKRTSRQNRSSHQDHYGHKFSPSAPTSALAAALVIASYADAKTGTVHMGARTLAAHLDVSERQARRHLEALRSRGYLRMIQQGRNHFGNARQSRYLLTTPNVQQDTDDALNGGVQQDGGDLLKGSFPDTGVRLNGGVQPDIGDSFSRTSSSVQPDTSVPLSVVQPSVHHQGPANADPRREDTATDDDLETNFVPMPDHLRKDNRHRSRSGDHR